MPVLMPTSTRNGSCSRYSRQACTTRPVSCGTTEARQMPVNSFVVWSTLLSNPWNCRPYSSGMRAWSVASLQCATRLFPLYSPSVRLVLPRSIVRSMFGLQDGKGISLRNNDYSLIIVRTCGKLRVFAPRFMDCYFTASMISATMSYLWNWGMMYTPPAQALS